MAELITISSSELDAYQRCPLMWSLGYAERWRAPFTGDKSTDRGTAFHIVLEVHYKVLKSTQDDSSISADERLDLAVNAAYERIEQMKEDNEFTPETIQAVEWMYTGYVERYGADKGWRILEIEATHIVPLYEPEEVVKGIPVGPWHEATDFNLKVKIDLVITDERDRLWIIDHKSAGRLVRTEKDFQWADQFGRYQFALRQLDYTVCGTIHNACLSKPNKGDLIFPGDPGFKSTMKPTPIENRFHRTSMDRTDNELRTVQWESLLTARKMYADEIPARHADPERCKYCDFSDACNFGRRNGDNLLRGFLQDTGFTQDFKRH